MREDWKKIDEFDWCLISTDGKCYSTKTKKLLKPQKYSNDYWFYAFKVGEEQFTRSIHRLVATAFIPNPENKPCVGHKDCDRSNNCVENLYWCTYPENNNHPLTRQRMSEGQKNSEKARNASIENFKKASLSNQKCVYKYSLDGVFIEKYNSVKEAAEKNGCFPQNISRCCKGRRNTCKGYKWSDYPL